MNPEESLILANVSLADLSSSWEANSQHVYHKNLKLNPNLTPDRVTAQVWTSMGPHSLLEALQQHVSGFQY